MKERPILFSAEMVRAILDGRKTQTRRILKPGTLKPNVRALRFENCDAAELLQTHRCPYGAPGDRLWVREASLPDPPLNGWSGDFQWDGCGRAWAGVPKRYRKPEHVLYRATWKGGDLKWKPSIHMPRWASRITLEIVSVRVERVQEISEVDAYREGVVIPSHHAFTSNGNPELRNEARTEFQALWHEINGPGSWERNDWVWVVEFKRVEGL